MRAAGTVRPAALALLAAFALLAGLLAGCQTASEPESVLTIPLVAGDHARADSVEVVIRRSATDSTPVAVHRAALEAGKDRIVIRHEGLLQGRFVAEVAFLKDGRVVDSWRWVVEGGRVGEPTPGPVGPGTPGGTRDTVPPLAPRVKGPAETSERQPAWAWSSGGRDGAGIYRLRLGDEPVSGNAEIGDTSWRPAADLPFGRHTLYVQERDTAGNWSAFGAWSIDVVDPGDKTPPEAPKVTGPATAGILRPAWTWTSGGGGAGVYRHRLDDADLTGAAETRETSWQPAANLAVGPHTLHVQERDAAGNWSASGSWKIEILTPKDTVPPAAPVVSGPEKTEDTRPTWTWKGGGGGQGTFRHRLGNDTLSGQAETSATTWRPAADLGYGVHTLHVQERDSAGNWSATGSWKLEVLAPKDTTPPNAPVVAGPATSGTSRPTWTWTSGGGGAGIYRLRLDDPSLAGRAETRETTWRPDSGLAAGSHTLYVQERDAAGNWSPTGSWPIQIELELLKAPSVSASPASPTNVSRPTWTWTGVGTAAFRYKLDDLNLETGATETAARTFQPAADLAEGTHILYVQEKDSLGRWSETGQASIRIDRTAPGAPALTRPASPTNLPRPAWSWISGGGGSGRYRYSLDEADVAGKGTEISALAFTPAAALGEGPHVFRVQERDSAGNWSAVAADTVDIDLTAPGAPGVGAPASPVEGRAAVFTFTPATGGDGTYRYRFNGGEWRETRTAQAASDTAAGSKVIAVQARDAAGNWSASAEDSAHVTSALAVLGAYPLRGSARDSAGTSGRLVLRNAPLLGEGASVNGISTGSGLPNPSNIRSAAIAGFDFANFSIEVEFKVDSFPAARRPVIVGGGGWRWLGFLIEPGGTVTMLHNNSSTVASTARYSLNTWHKARMAYAGGVATISLDGVVAATHTVALTTGNDNNVSVTNGSNATIFKGRVRNLIVQKGAELLAHWPLLQDGADDAGLQPNLILTNIPFGTLGGAYVAGIYEGNDAVLGTNITTPTLTAFNFAAFSVAVRVRPDALPATTMPLVMGGTSFRWMGALLESDGTVSLSSGGVKFAASTVKLTAGTDHSVRILYSAGSGRAWLFLNGSLAASGPLATLNHGNNRTLGFANFSNGSVFKGTVQDIRIHSR